jgi:PAS domain S-box-containing protein
MPDQDTVFQRVMEHAPISIQFQDRNGLTVRVNDAYLALFGYDSRDQVEGVLNVRSNPVLAAQGQNVNIERAYAGELVRSPAVPYTSINSRKMVVQSTFVPVFNDSGAVDGLLIFHEDISALCASERTAEQRARLLIGLQEAHRGIANRLRVRDVLEAVMDTAQSLLGADKVALWELDAEGGWVAHAQRGLSASYAADLTAIRHASSILQERTVSVAHDARPMTYTLSAPDPRLEAFNDLLKREHIHSLIAAPLISGTSVSGTLTCYMSDGDDFDPILVETTCLLADQAAIAIHNARLFEEITLIRDRLEERVRESTERLEAAHKEALANEKLAAVGFLANEVAHGLRNPLNVVSASAYYLKMRCPAHDEKVERHFGAITRAVAQAADMISDMITLATGSQPRFGDVNLNELARHAVEDRAPAASGLVETAWAADLPVVLGDWTQLTQAVKSLVANALAARRVLPVQITTARDGDMAVISVGDDRPPIRPGEVENAFGPFSTSATYWTGLGLSVARQIAESHKGGVRIDERDGVTWFRLEVPAKPAEPREL